MGFFYWSLKFLIYPGVINILIAITIENKPAKIDIFPSPFLSFILSSIPVKSSAIPKSSTIYGAVHVAPLMSEYPANRPVRTENPMYKIFNNIVTSFTNV